VKAPTKGDFDLVPEFPPEAEVLQPYHIFTGRIPSEGNALSSRKPIVHGPRTSISVSKPIESMPMDTFFRNGERHEVYFVQDGEGVVRSEYGDLKFRKDVYVAIPKGTTYRIDLTSPKAWFLLVESIYPITFAPHYLNKEGQATLMSPVVETEIETPDLPPFMDQRGEFPIDVKHGGGKITRITLGHHPFDLAGWEGALYPFVFDIKSHHGIARPADAPDVPVRQRPPQRLLPMLVRPGDGRLAPAGGPGTVCALQRRFGRVDVLLQRVLRRPRRRHRGGLVHLPSRLDAAQSPGERGPALPRGPGEGAGAPRGHA